jgi:hypothetical protein
MSFKWFTDMRIMPVGSSDKIFGSFWFLKMMRENLPPDIPFIRNFNLLLPNSWWQPQIDAAYSMSVCKCQKLNAPYTDFKVFLVAMKHGILILKLGHDGIWSINFVDFIIIFRQRLHQNLSKTEKLQNTSKISM